MNRKAITEELSRLTEKYINPTSDTRLYWAKEVTFDYRTENQIRVDYMHFVPMNNTISGIEHGDFYCYEIKSSVEDFNSKNGHNFIGDFNYYVMPFEVYEKVKNNIPYGIGVYVPFTDDFQVKHLRSVKTARRSVREKPLTEMLFMMFRSANREIEKIRRDQNND